MQNKRAVAILFVAAMLFVFSGYTPSSAANPQNGEFFYVTRVIDGDTLKLSNGQRIRLIGVDTPEVHYSHKLLADSKRIQKDIKSIQELGRKAATFTSNLCYNKKVKLEFDVQKRDKYDRLLAYVYLEDGTFVNAKILEEGYGQAMTIAPDVKYADYFLKLQKEARENKRGLWKE